MSKGLALQTCCVCLSCKNNLFPLSTVDEQKLSIKDKLQNCVWDIEWWSEYRICIECAELLNDFYNFRETCLKSEEIRKKQQSDNSSLNAKGDAIEDNPDEASFEDNCDDNLSGSDEEKVAVKDEEFSEDSEEKPKIKKSHRRKPGSKNAKRKQKYFEFKCDRCELVYKSTVKLRMHCIKEHGMTKQEIKPFKCDLCDRRFGNSSNLVQHVKYHDGVRSNMCSFCGKGFITKADMTLHEKQHLNKREYVCTTCNKCYNTHKDLRSHLLVVHTDPSLWKFNCEVCNKRFPIKSNYDCHVRRHTGERNFSCEICSRKFAEKCVLQRHMKTHSNVREFRCTQCDKEYKDKYVMQVHMAKAHGVGLGQVKLPAKERKYQCHLCAKAYYAKNKLARHLYTHTGEKPFFCTVCPKKFHDKSYVKQHMKKAHSIEYEKSMQGCS